MLSTAAAILLLGERPAPLALAGAAFVGVGVFVIASGPRRTGGPPRGQAIAYGLLTGVAIAVYTLWDKHAVSALLVPPLLLYYGTAVVRLAILAPVAVRRRAEVRAHWHRHRREALGIAALAPLSYILVLTALVFTPVSYVAPAREVSILIGAAMGTRLLAEGDPVRRLAGAGAMVTGVIALASA